MRGRPYKYKPEYCQMLIDHMSKGYSFESFAGVVKVCIQTLYKWSYDFEDFEKAKAQAFAECQLFWEKVGIAGMAGKVDGFNVTAWIFNMKNRFRWHDRQEVQHELGENTQKILIDAKEAKQIIQGDPIDVKVIDTSSE